jgi:ribosomal protein S28E/S33
VSAAGGGAVQQIARTGWQGRATGLRQNVMICRPSSRSCRRLA